MRKIWGAAGLAALALTVSACASSASSTASTANTPAAGGSSPAAAGGGAISERTIGGQQVVTNAQGMTLYWFVPDTSTTSMCTGQCATFWPPVKGPVTAGSGVTGTLGTITRSDPSGTQVTYDGHPLYTFVGDKAAGENNGNGKNLSGGVWHEMTVSGSTPAPGAGSTSTSSGGYGY